MTPEYTGPPIGDPPEHVHENEPVVDALEDTQEEVDDLTAQVQALETVSATRHAELLERINTCSNRLEMISSAATSENPLLTQIISQLAEVKAELTSLKSSMDTTLNRLAPNALIPETVPLSAVVEDPPEAEIITVENPTLPVERKRRFV